MPPPNSICLTSGRVTSALGVNEALPAPAPSGLDRLRQSIEAETTALDKARAGLWGWLAELGRLFTNPTPSAVRWAGAAALAAITSGAYVPAKGEKIAILLCGANPAPIPI